jgi:membrane fusion protein (multidrug efflux system)
MVNLGDQVQINQELFEIIDFDSIVARVFVPEKHLAELRTGLPARISAQTAGGDRYSGRVKRIAPVVDPRSGTVKVTVDVGDQAGLRPGMYVDVDLVTATHADAVLVPKRALVYDSDQIFVYRLVEENRVERVFIEPRLTDKHYVEPVAGLGSGDRIVVAGQAGLKEGALVSLPGEVDEDDDARSGKDAEPSERAAA